MEKLQEWVEKLHKIHKDKRDLLIAEREISEKIVENLPVEVITALREGIVRLNFQAPRGFYTSIRNKDKIDNLRRMVR